MCCRLLPILALLCCLSGGLSDAADTPQQANAAISKVLREAGLRGTPADVPGTMAAVGITRQETRIPAILGPGDRNAFGSPLRRVLLVAGLDGTPASLAAGLAAYRWFQTSPDAVAFRRQFTLSLIPVANPDGYLAGTGPQNGSQGDPTVGYPPPEPAYQSASIPEAQYLWRWIGLHGPDLVVVFDSGEALSWQIADDGLPVERELARLLGSETAPPAGGLAAALSKTPPAEVGVIPAVGCTVTEGDGPQAMGRLLAAASRLSNWPISPNRAELKRRLDRTPLDVAEELSRTYGRKISSPVYTQTVALIGRLKLAQLTANRQHTDDVVRIVAPWFSGDQPSIPKPNGSAFAGHLVFAELARVTGDPHYAKLVQDAADYGFDEQGQPRSAMPTHSEMSDAVFMACPILCEAGALTGDEKYFDMAARHLQFMLDLNLRPDGLHQHSPLHITPWGRGNGFPALGLALSLSVLPDDNRHRPPMLTAYRAHLTSLLPHQDPTGAWHQVVDEPGSYREFTSTCMITFSIIRGIRRGWLPADEYRPVVDRAWEAIQIRIGPHGRIVDGCTGTGKQTSKRAYLDRQALLGVDDRCGSMGLLVSTELAAWQAEQK